MILVESYCENLTFFPIAQPANFISNLSFLVGFFGAVRNRLHRLGDRHFQTIDFFNIMILGVGLGSATFHFYPSLVTMMIDVIPIYICIATVITILVFQYSVVEGRNKHRLFGFFIAVSIIGALAPRSLVNGSVIYLCILGYFLVLTRFLDLNIRQDIFKLCGLFAIAIGFRSIDRWVCPQVVVGTHFIWHIMCGFILYRISALLLRLRIINHGTQNFL